MIIKVILEEVGVFLKNFLGIIRKFFLRKNSDSEVQNKDSEFQFSKNYYEELDDLHKLIESSYPQLSKELISFIGRSIDFFWHFGRKDGSVGQKQMNKSFFRTHAGYIQAELIGQLESKRVKFEVEYKKHEKVLEEKTKTKEDSERYLNEVLTRKELYPTNYSRWLGVFYILLAILLILADVPLALKLTQLGFNLDIDISGLHSIDKLFIISQECEEDNLWDHMWLVFSNNWEVFILAFGVAICTVYIKIFYEDFIGYPIDKSVRQFKIIDRYGVFTEEEKRSMILKYRARIAFKVFILILTLITIVFLGYFRSEISQISIGMNAPTDEVYIYDLSDSYVQHLAKICFILITILFPIIGGICLSLGVRNFQNLREISEANKHFKSKNDEYTDSLVKFTEVSKNKQICEQNLQTIRSENFVDDYTNLFYYCYQHGYERGVVEPDKSLDIYERVEKLRDRLISTRSFDAVQNSFL